MLLLKDDIAIWRRSEVSLTHSLSLYPAINNQVDKESSGQTIYWHNYYVTTKQVQQIELWTTIYCNFLMGKSIFVEIETSKFHFDAFVFGFELNSGWKRWEYSKYLVNLVTLKLSFCD